MYADSTYCIGKAITGIDHVSLNEMVIKGDTQVQLSYVVTGPKVKFHEKGPDGM